MVNRKPKTRLACVRARYMYVPSGERLISAGDIASIVVDHFTDDDRLGAFAYSRCSDGPRARATRSLRERVDAEDAPLHVPLYFERVKLT